MGQGYHKTEVYDPDKDDPALEAHGGPIFHDIVNRNYVDLSGAVVITKRAALNYPEWAETIRHRLRLRKAESTVNHVDSRKGVAGETDSRKGVAHLLGYENKDTETESQTGWTEVTREGVAKEVIDRMLQKKDSRPIFNYGGESSEPIHIDPRE